VNNSGYQHAYGAMAGISAAVLCMWPIFFFCKSDDSHAQLWLILTIAPDGKRIRHVTLNWPIIRTLAQWNMVSFKKLLASNK
jgi:hypothetical protein